MRNLSRNKREIYYSARVGSEPIYDEYGNDTLEKRNVYAPPTLLSVNVSTCKGKYAVQVFGEQSDYTRVLCISGGVCPLNVGTKVWVGLDTTKENDYIVKRVADSKNGFLVLLQEVAGNE